MTFCDAFMTCRHSCQAENACFWIYYVISFHEIWKIIHRGRNRRPRKPEGIRLKTCANLAPLVPKPEPACHPERTWGIGNKQKVPVAPAMSSSRHDLSWFWPDPSHSFGMTKITVRDDNNSLYGIKDSAVVFIDAFVILSSRTSEARIAKHPERSEGGTCLYAFKGS